MKGILTASYLARWKSDVAGHLTPLPYTSISNAPCTHTHLAEAMRARVSWKALVAQRCVMQLRCGYIQLGHVNGKPSKALVKWRIFCQRRYSSITTHVVCSCPGFRDAREDCILAGLDCTTLSFLTVSPHHLGFEAITRLAQEICSRADTFWRIT